MNNDDPKLEEIRQKLIQHKNEIDKLIRYVAEMQIDKTKSSFWQAAERASKEVDSWPDWKKQGFSAGTRGKRNGQ
ncbi:MAG: hypothetical protein UT24_C0018G0026 [Candidatus Woesebacteria bacterium GW2011_GWB1_39_12]|uniref:Uncharacterized protein n=1 Tax=Candidatus Woesebacteria bacterium GW2011_GWB1_39_12 TaxID=1618574 RepID=A0A0G0M7B1_9BACT|nr:MAG: hypothetical protein UT24_C0018G0026 [Candidatus Woesebacteria bacterium GW2011_GWB1_39_12]